MLEILKSQILQKRPIFLGSLEQSFVAVIFDRYSQKTFENVGFTCNGFRIHVKCFKDSCEVF